jgi:ParB family chromosome partitioning protein
VAKRRLGRGLDALIPGGSRPNAVESISVDLIDPNPRQPRRSFDMDALAGLAQSVKEHGVVQPILVRRKDGRYELVAGERRLRAAEMVGLVQVPAIVGDFEDRDAMEVALIENLQREDLDPIEEATALQRLRDDFGLTQEELSTKLGKSRPAIANSLRLLSLEKEIRDDVSRGTISAGHARALLAITDSDTRMRLFGQVVEQELSVRQTEELVKSVLESAAATDVSRETPHRPSKDPNIVEVESTLRKILGTKVEIKDRMGRGRIQIEYYSLDDLERILEILQSSATKVATRPGI